MLAGIGKMSTFAPQFTTEERWVSGWNQQFAKLSYSARGTGGSNPPFSAKERRRCKSSFFSGYGVFFFGVWRSPASAPALGAGGRRFESFCPDLKIKELQGVVTPFFWPFQKSGHKKDTLFRNISYRFPILFSNSPAKKDTLFGLFQKMPPPKGRHHANKLLMSTERCKYTTFSIFTTLL